jgi:hypothetical protein
VQLQGKKNGGGQAAVSDVQLFLQSFFDLTDGINRGVQFRSQRLVS